MLSSHSPERYVSPAAFDLIPQALLRKPSESIIFGKDVRVMPLASYWS